MLRKTKIHATLGPASSSEIVLSELVTAGVSAFRINFSHSNAEQARYLIRTIRRLAAESGTPLTIRQDLQGPRIRIGELRNGRAFLEAGQQIILTSEPLDGSNRIASVSYPDLPKDVRADEIILIDEAAIHLKVVESDGVRIRCKVLVGGELLPRKGINLPSTRISMPILTEKDKVDLAVGVELGVDLVSLSFVRSAQDILAARDYLRGLGCTVPIVAKIERREAVLNAREIIDASDGIALARGDLGLEGGYHELFYIQDHFIRECNNAEKMIMVGGEVMDTMIKHPGPTRSECIDVTHLVLSGVDGISLSGETAVGRYPVQSVQILDRIIRRAENSLGYYQGEDDIVPLVQERYRPVRESSLKGVDAIVVESDDLTAVTTISKARPRCPILAIAENGTANWLNTWWGVYPVTSLAFAQKRGILIPGAKILRVSSN